MSIQAISMDYFLAVLLQPKDCQDILWSGSNISGVYTIYPQGTGGFKAYCDMKTDGGGWTVRKATSFTFTYFLS